LSGWGQLHLVANQDDVPRTNAHRRGIRKRDLSRLIDEQVIELLIEFLSREKPSGPGDQIVSALRRFAVVGRILDDRPVQKLLFVRRLLDTPEPEPTPCRDLLDLLQQLIDRLVRMR
jgi:hypothetical protein